MSIAVLGIGNLLLKDEGVGVHVVNRLKNEYQFPDSVKLIDGGTMGLDLLPFFEDSDKILIIDAVNLNKKPGTIDIVEGDKIPAYFNSKLSVHQIGLPDMLFAARLMDITPSEMCLIGIQPLSMETGTDMSDEIKRQIEPLLERIIQKLRDWGVDVVLKTRNHV